MKALTNILNYMLLMLLLMLVACTHDDAEVENLSHGDKYVSVRMHVPGMKSSFSRAAEDNLTSIVALVFRDDVLISNTEVLDLTPNSDLTGTFKIPQPNEGDNIHFLGNLPETVKSKLPETGGSQTEVLRNLETDDFSNLSYWGMATYSGGDIDVTLYRNMAKVEIAAGPNCTFRDDELYIAGLVKPIGKGTLVPYQDGFTFNLKEYDYNTLPNDLTGERYNNKLPSPVKSLYIFEHDNPGTADGLYIICKIGETGNCFYKVALIDENKEPYPIIRNHRYVIYVDDLDEGADSFDVAANSAPVNFTVKEIRDVTISVSSNQIDLNETLPVQVTVPDGSKLKELTITAPDFTITEGGNNLSQSAEGVYTFSGEKTGTTTYYFKPNSIGTDSITIAGSGDYLNNFSQTIQVTVSSSIKAQADKSKLYYDSEGDAQIVRVNVTVPDGVNTLNIGGASNFTIDKTAGDGSLNGTTYTMGNDRTATFTFTLNQQNVTSQQTITFSGENVNAASVIISMAQTPKVTFSPDENSKTMSVNDTYTVTMNVPNSGTLTALNIAAEGFTVTASSGSLSGPTDNVYSYTGGTTQFTFTPTSAGSRTIRFYDGQGVDINVPEKQISVKVNAAITAEANSSEVYCDDSTKKNVTVDVVIPKGVSTLNITTEDFTVTQNGNALQPNGNVYTYTNGDATNQQTVQFVFTLKDSVTEPKNQSTITFSDASGNQYVVNGIVNITITETQEVTNALTVTPLTSTTIDLTDGGNNTVQLRLTIPDNVSQFMINANEAFTIKVIDNAVGLQNNNGIYYCYDKKSKTTIDLELTMNDQNIFMTAGEYTITISENNNTSNSCSQTIVATNNSLSDGVIWEGSKEAVNSGYILYYTSFIKYKDSDKKLKVDITTTGDGWKQFTIRYKNDYGNSLGALQGQTIDSTLSIDIPAENRDVVISGQGGITITKIYVE